VNSLLANDSDMKKRAFEILESLLKDLGLPKDENSTLSSKEMAYAINEWVDEGKFPDNFDAEDDYYLGLDVPYRTSNYIMSDISELRLIRGFTDADIDALREYVAFLPPDVAINVNTLDPQLASHIESKGQETFIDNKTPEEEENGFDNVPSQPAPPTSASPGGTGGTHPKNRAMELSVVSEYFLLEIDILVDETLIESKSVIYRPRKPTKEDPIRVIRRERGKPYDYGQS